MFLAFPLCAGHWALGQAFGGVGKAKKRGHAGWPSHLGSECGGVHLRVTLIGEEDS